MENAAKVAPRGVHVLDPGLAGMSPLMPAHLRVKAPNLALKRETRPPRSSIW